LYTSPRLFSNSQAGLLYVYSITAIGSAKSNAKRLRDQDGGTLDLHRQSLRQHGLLNDRHSVGAHSPPVGGIEVPVAQPPVMSEVSAREEAIRAEVKRRKEEALAREMEEMKKEEKERYSLWNWVRGK
jgi:hypothetical protein